MPVIHEGMRSSWRSRFGLRLLCALCGALIVSPVSAGPTPDVADASPLVFSSVATQRFLASHGTRALLMGYPETGLEFWAYPLQIVSGYRIGFRPEGAASETDGRSLLSRVIATPDRITRIYTGPDYVVRETLFVPLDQPAGLLEYQVEAEHPLDIVIHFAPVLDLMWPAALGGQNVRWNADVPGYVMSEPEHGFSALIGSAQTVAHDNPVNSTLHADGRLAFSIRAEPEAGGGSDRPAVARVWIAQLSAEHANPAGVLKNLQAGEQRFKDAATAHYRSLRENSLRLHTPDAAVDDALAWAQVALDQAWVCNPELGCGLVAGYGPSRPGRRPQYAWFFAGDGLIASEALIASGAFARAKEELEFIMRYQDARTGMVWHELAQSANYVNWAKQPHMFVHVDISFAFLNTLAHYVAASGDNDFALRHWGSIAAAYRYCQSLIRGADHLPHIPADKSAGDEQHSPADDLGLSTSWVEASESFAALAKLAGHSELVAAARRASALARESVAKNYWDAKRDFWIGSHTASGAPIFSRGSGPGSALGAHIFSPSQDDTLLDQIASAKFQTDWGTRGIGSDSTIYAPWSYATGSIFAVHSTQSALTFWQAHRPLVAWPIFRGIVPWSTLDAPGHIHEVLAGNYYRPQTESVPEQIWSSAGLLDAAVRGLFGIEVQAATNTLVLLPHMPAEWNELAAQNIRLPHSTIDFALHQDDTSVDLDIADNGEAATLRFAPRIPLGADIVDAQCNGSRVEATAIALGEDTHAQLVLSIVQGASHCHVRLSGGVSILLPRTDARIGDASHGMKLTHVRLQGHALSIDVDVHAQGPRYLDLRTPWQIQSVRGAGFSPASGGVYRIELPAQTGQAPDDGYSSKHVEVDFANS